MTRFRYLPVVGMIFYYPFVKRVDGFKSFDENKIAGRVKLHSCKFAYGRKNYFYEYARFIAKDQIIAIFSVLKIIWKFCFSRDIISHVIA